MPKRRTADEAFSMPDFVQSFIDQGLPEDSRQPAPRDVHQTATPSSKAGSRSERDRKVVSIAGDEPTSPTSALPTPQIEEKPFAAPA